MELFVARAGVLILEFVPLESREKFAINQPRVSIRATIQSLRRCHLRERDLCARDLSISDCRERRRRWLRYSALGPRAAKAYGRLPANTVLLGDSPVLHSAQQELLRGTPANVRPDAQRPRRFLAAKMPSFSELGRNCTRWLLNCRLTTCFPTAIGLKSAKIHGSQCLLITASTDRGVLYGVFALLSKIARAESLEEIDEVEQPYAPIRWVNQWDNLDGSIERGYGGPSIFFADGMSAAI